MTVAAAAAVATTKAKTEKIVAAAKNVRDICVFGTHVELLLIEWLDAPLPLFFY